MTTRYFLDEFFTPPALLMRKAGQLDQAWINRVWRDTKRIIDWMFGHNDFANEITEVEARRQVPEAFER